MRSKDDKTGGVRGRKDSRKETGGEKMSKIKILSKGKKLAMKTFKKRI